MLTAILHSTLPAYEAPPEWVHLVPAGRFRGADGRGPYALEDAAAVIAASMAGGPIVLDENHATDHALKTGMAAPAMGWIVDLQAREDGIWGRVEWTPGGVALMAGRAYRGISPVFVHNKAGRVLEVLRAALTNAPNLLALKTLHTQEPEMDLTALREALGLPADADDAAILTAVTANSRTAAAAQSQATALQTQVTNMAATVIALQTQVDAADEAARRDRATTAIDAAISAGKPIKALRDHYIARHMADAAAVETEFAAMISLHTGGAKPRPLAGGPDGALDASEMKVVAMLGLDPEAYRKSKAMLGQTVEAA